MANFSQLIPRHRLFMESYDYRVVDWGSGSILQKPIGEARIAVVTTAAFYSPSQQAFDTNLRGGDCSFRAFASDVDLATLQIAHRSSAFDSAGIDADKNLALPLDRLRELQSGGVIGELAPRHFSFMGSIIEPENLIGYSAPEVARELIAGSVDAVLLTPV